MHKRLSIVFLLGFSSGLPLALLTSTLQAWFAASGMPVFMTGLLSLLGLPYVYKFLWAGFLDRFALSSLGLRRSWILFTQIALLIGFNLMAFFTPEHSAHVLAIIAFVLVVFSATQDASIDAHRSEYLPTSEHGLGASLAVLAYRFALLIAGGLALVMAGKIGWSWTYHIMGFLMLPGILAVLLSKEPRRSNAFSTSSFWASLKAPLQDLSKRPNMVPLVLFILLYKFGEAFTTTTSGIVMPFLIQGIGFSLDTIGYINKMLGIASIIFGGLLAGFLLLRWSLYRALMVFGFLQALANLSFIALAILGKNLPLFALAVIADNFAAGLASTALVALFMRLVRQPYVAAQFSLLVAVASLPRTLSGPVAAFVQMHIGWVGLYQMSFLLALAFVPFLLRMKGDGLFISGEEETIQRPKALPLKN